MNTTNVIILAVVIVILLCLTMFITELFIPLNRKFDMNSICRNYMYIIEKNGNLSNDEIAELNDLLHTIGLSDIKINVSASGSKLGDSVIFKVEAQSVHSSISQFFTRSTERIHIDYERKLTIKKIIN